MYPGAAFMTGRKGVPASETRTMQKFFKSLGMFTSEAEASMVWTKSIVRSRRTGHVAVSECIG